MGRYLNADPIGQDGGVNVYGYVLNSPTNLSDPKGLYVLQVVGAALGGGAAAYNNYDNYQRGDISGWQYAQTVAFGAGTGVLASFAPTGILSGVLAGSLSSASNNLLLQSMTSECIDTDSLQHDALLGAAGGGIAAGFGKIGGQVVRGQNVIGSRISHPLWKVGKAMIAPKTYESLGITLGGAVGTYIGTEGR